VSEQVEQHVPTGEVIDLVPRLRRGQDQPIRVLVAHQRRLVAESLLFVLDSDPRLEPIGYALDVEEAVELAILLEPDVVVASSELTRLDDSPRGSEELQVWRRATRVHGSRANGISGADGSEPRSTSLRVTGDQCAEDLLATIEAVFIGAGSHRQRVDRLPRSAGLSA
jgi:DNA-binding NarL/FixJ family response regulator